MNICFLTSGHDPFDDRIFYHMARSLAHKKYHIGIISSTTFKNEVIDDINLNCFDAEGLSKKEKVRQFTERLTEFRPEVIICSEPLPLYAAHSYSKGQNLKARTIYDITEWYPSKKNLCHYNPLIRWFFFIKLLAFNIWVSGVADSFIFGEWYKSRPYRFLFPFKPFTFISYYPDLIFTNYTNPEIRDNKIKLSYSGKISNDKGFGNFIKVIDLLSDRRKNMKIEVKIIGWHDEYCEKNAIDFNLPDKQNVSFTFYDRQPFIEYPDLIKDTDIFIDLRDNDLENNHCLPIKLFYYAAMTRPVIFSDLKSIRKEIDINEFVLLVNPADTNEIVKIILMYIDNSDLYIKHSLAARRKVEQKYNWNLLESQFIDFVTS